MQISKVSNMRAGVKSKELSGIIYQSPSTGKPEKNVGETVRERIKAAQRMYSPLKARPAAKGKETDEFKEYLNVHSVLNRYFGQFRREWESLTADKMKRYPKESDVEISKEAVVLYVPKCLKKTLVRNAELIGAITELCLYLTGQGPQPAGNKLEMIAKEIKADYLQSGKAKEITRSIERQNLVIQPQDDTLSLSGLENESTGKSYKLENKKAFWEFLKLYATPSDDSRKAVREKLRRLLVLYIYGKGEVPEGSFDEWSDHTEKRRIDAFILDKVNDLPTEEIVVALSDRNMDADKKAVYTRCNNYLPAALRDTNIASFRNAMSVAAEDDGRLYFENDAINEFWIRYFSKSFEKVCAKASLKKPYTIEKGYISEKIWKDALDYIAIKYVAIGKEVWHFTMDDIDAESGDKHLGEIPEKIKNGVSSFDFELIKAKESLQRELAGYVAFAGNNYAQATLNMKDNDDFFLLKLKNKNNENEIADRKKPDTLKNTLMFFGGISEWKKSEQSMKFINEISTDESEDKLIDDIRRLLYSIRNDSFHFTTKRHDDFCSPAIQSMFLRDIAEVSNIVRKQYYSNNLPVFYEVSDIEKLMNILYDKNVNRKSQVPSFRKILPRNNFQAFISDKLKIHGLAKAEDNEKLRSSLYFLLKEVYYNDFLISDKARECFIKSIRRNDFDNKDQKKERAVDDFKNAVNLVQNRSLEEICQYIMAEQNRQNQRQGSQKVADSSKSDEKKFKHYSLLLEEGLRDAFVLYLNLDSQESSYSFIRKARVREIPEFDAFLPKWEGKAFATLAEELKAKPYLMKWYVMGRLLPSKQLNHLNGTFRDHIQFVGDVNKRAKSVGVTPAIEVQTEDYDDVCLLLDICSKVAGTFSNSIYDYFEDESDYKEFLGKYVDLGDLSDESMSKYCDAVNPIPNRNVIIAKLYGCDRILSKVVPTVEDSDVRRRNELEEDIKSYKETGKTKNIDEQKKLITYQQLSNKVELNGISKYAEIIYELLGQLINWSFLRERDLMYFQLGFHYLCLKNDSRPGYGFIITPDGDKVHNAILWQIAALYVNGMHLYVDVDTSGRAQKEDENSTTSAGAKIGCLLKYTEKLGYSDKETLYRAGLELFENYNEHDEIVKTRNYIDHFRYFSGERSILGLYSEVFDRFFSYNNGFRKNVPVVLSNILQRHFISSRIVFDNSGTKKVNKENEKTMSLISFSGNGLWPDNFTYKFGDKTSAQIPAVSSDFIRDVAYILYYPTNVPENIVNDENVEKRWNNPKVTRENNNQNRRPDNNYRKGGGKFQKPGDRNYKGKRPEREEEGETEFARKLREAGITG